MDTSVIERPKTLQQVAEWSESLEDFGRHLRDWQHEIQRGDVHSRPELEQRLRETPPYLDGKFGEGDVADAYLAAYLEFTSVTRDDVARCEPAMAAALLRAEPDNLERAALEALADY